MADKRRVFVLGAGFTRAFIPDAPLVDDYYNLEELTSRYKDFIVASRILGVEVNAGRGRLNIERLMTRLDGSMPYDSENDADQLRMLLADLLRIVVSRLREATEGNDWHRAEMAALAGYCLKNGVTCITFNYDEAFDRALWEVEKVDRVEQAQRPYWHPDGGYGFFCKPSDSCVGQGPVVMDRVGLLLLKLHGSLNWRPKRGTRPPYAIDDVVHHETWLPRTRNYLLNVEAIEAHLAPEPFLVPPVLMKSALVNQPILRLVWSLAYDELRKAEEVVFVGYSFPTTDIAARFLFLESLEHFPHPEIRVVNYATDDAARAEVIRSYQAIFPGITLEQFDFRGAMEWAKGLSQVEGTTERGQL